MCDKDKDKGPSRGEGGMTQKVTNGLSKKSRTVKSARSGTGK